MTSRYDMHYDHAYFGLFGIEAIQDIQLENEKFQPTVHEAIIHSHMTDEVYPKDQGNYGWNHELDTYLGAWQHLDGLEEKTMLNWSERENVLTPYSMRQGPFKYNLRIKHFVSIQQSTIIGLLHSQRLTKYSINMKQIVLDYLQTLLHQVKTVVTADGMTRVQLRQSMVLQMVMQQDLQIFIQDSHGLNG